MALRSSLHEILETCMKWGRLLICNNWPALNRELNTLFSSSACSKLPYRKWFDKYNFLDAYHKGEDEWMAE